MKTLREIMTDNVVTVMKQDSIDVIASKMKNENIGFIPVVEGKQLAGVVTDRDLVIRGLAEKLPDSTPVEQVMTKQPVTAAPDTTVDEAAKIMASRKIRRLPVVDNGELVGVVAIGDMAVRNNLEDEAAKALSEISSPTKEMAGAVTS